MNATILDFKETALHVAANEGHVDVATIRMMTV